MNLGIHPLNQTLAQRIRLIRLFPIADRLMWPSVTAGLAMLVYLFTIAPDLTWANYGGDGGELITASVTLGIPHPPGYPLYLLAGKIASYLPVGTIAYRYNLHAIGGLDTVYRRSTAATTKTNDLFIFFPIL